MCGIMLAMVGFAAMPNSWPMFVVPAVGFGLSGAGIVLANRVGTDVSRRLRLGVHSTALAIYCVIVIGLLMVNTIHRR
jgi:hypothetical protein